MKLAVSLSSVPLCIIAGDSQRNVVVGVFLHGFKQQLNYVYTEWHRKKWTTLHCVSIIYPYYCSTTVSFL